MVESCPCGRLLSTDPKNSSKNTAHGISRATRSPTEVLVRRRHPKHLSFWPEVSPMPAIRRLSPLMHSFELPARQTQHNSARALRRTLTSAPRASHRGKRHLVYALLDPLSIQIDGCRCVEPAWMHGQTTAATPCLPCEPRHQAHSPANLLSGQQLMKSRLSSRGSHSRPCGWV